LIGRLRQTTREHELGGPGTGAHELSAHDGGPSRFGRRSPLNRRTLIRRALIVADLVGLSIAFGATVALFGLSGPGAHARPAYELLVFMGSLPAWALLASLYGLYGHDERRVGHSNVDDFVGVVNLVTLGAWIFFLGCWATHISNPRPAKLFAFWLLSALVLTTGRALARSWCRRSAAYVQNAIVLGGGEVGQVIARKLLQHPEYGIRLVGLVDDMPTQLREDLAGLRLLGGPNRLREIVLNERVERVVVAFSNDPDARTVAMTRALGDLDVQIDIVPRLFELVGPSVEMHSVEGVPLLGVVANRWNPAALALKRVIDIVGSVALLVLVSPLFGLIAWKVRRSSPGPVFFRQRRLGLNMREFTAYKFRSMWIETDDTEHRAYIERTMSPEAAVGTNGVYKLERPTAVTPVGRWLRKTSLDELPQLFNVLRGEMSLVGPRPCIPYETANFKPHHFERFLMPAGLTGLWQVVARAHSTFGEALDMDVAYVRAWSLWLDLRLLFRTPFMLLRGDATA
jgi:exopolysaccharide biosynthesis polyprenyl glycosylphosphotransferase